MLKTVLKICAKNYAKNCVKNYAKNFAKNGTCLNKGVLLKKSLLKFKKTAISMLKPMLLHQMYEYIIILAIMR